jgi:hypothetical protein
MAKPILLITLPFKLNIIESKVDATTENIRIALKDEYHVLAIRTDQTEIKFETLNDCKGLPDVDIKALIDKYNVSKAS